MFIRLILDMFLQVLLQDKMDENIDIGTIMGAQVIVSCNDMTQIQFHEI